MAKRQLDCSKRYNKWICDLLGKYFECRPDAPTKPLDWAHLRGIGMFYGLMPWNGNGIYNDAPRDMPTLIADFAKAGGNLLQFQLLYEDGALFIKGKGLTLDPAKVAYVKAIIAECRKRGVCVLLALTDYCTCKKEARWKMSPLNAANGGPYGGAFDVFGQPDAVYPYIEQVVAALNADNVAFEICNEGSMNTNFARNIRNKLQALGITRISNSGANPGGLWRFSSHGETHWSAVKTGQLPNTDGETWKNEDVPEICAKVMLTPDSGFVWDGSTDAKHDWLAFLAGLRIGTGH